MRIEAPAGLEKMTEKQFQALVVEAATMLGWYVVHFPQMAGNPSGWPDLTCLVNDDYRLIELKRAGRNRRPTQHSWVEEKGDPYNLNHHLIDATSEGWNRLMDVLGGNDGPS
jgi:hypothetical protein